MKKKKRRNKKDVQIKRQKKKRRIKKTVKIKRQKKKRRKINVKDIQKKYKRKEVVCFTWKEKAGYHALSTAKVRSRLQHLMGTDVIRINDKHYIDKMSQKLEIEQEVEVCKKEQALEDAEDERLRSLQLSGVLPKPKQASLQVKPKREHMKLSQQKKSKNKLVEEKNEENAILIEEETADQRDMTTQVEVIEQPNKDDRIKSKVTKKGQCLTKDHKGDLKNTDQSSHTSETISSKETEIKKEVKYNNGTYTKQENKKRTPERTSTGKFAQKETPFVKELRETETVGELYDMAEKLMSPRIER
ncbi:glutamic acid-rich protein-like [Mytilus californianus]|uniref:glutamic acid-rich protein-like n=1 Tax=Mytilus californianus TaxID=6549 RepID=UPI0022485E05|nr:glutamic acid-rich protein-like [Mytilus californianus]